MQEKMVIYYLECNIYFILLYINFSKYMIMLNNIYLLLQLQHYGNEFPIQ